MTSLCFLICGVSVAMVTCLPYFVSPAPCCAPKQWGAEVRVVAMDTSSDADGEKGWYWMSYDLDRQQVAIIHFDPRPGHGDFYQREVLDYRKGRRSVTSDEVHCKVYPLTGSLQRLCVPPPGGNITFDYRQFFGVWPDPSQPLTTHTVSHSNHPPHHPSSTSARSGINGEDPSGVFAETIYYEAGDVVGYVTVTGPTCNFVNEMSYMMSDDGFVWQHTQLNNQTATVDPQSFDMPKSCDNATVTQVSPGFTWASTHGLIARSLMNF